MEKNNELVAYFSDEKINALVTNIEQYDSLPISQFATEDDFIFAKQFFNKVQGRIDYKKCVMIKRIFDLKLYGNEKPEEYCAKIVDVKKSSVYNYAKIAKWIDEDGNYSLIINEPNKNDFSTTAILRLIESGLSLEKVKSLYLSGDITPNTSIQKLTALIKKEKGLKEDITDNAEVKEVKEQSAEVENTEVSEKPKTEKQPLTIAKIFENTLKTLNENGFTFADLTAYYDSIK